MLPQRALRGHRPARPSDRAAVSGQHLALLAGHLTPRDRWLARAVHEYRTLTTHQVAALAFPSVRAANHRLLQLYRWRVLDRFQPFVTSGSAPMHYVLDLAGALVLAAEDHPTTDTDDSHSRRVRELAGYRRDRALAVAHSLRLAHTTGITNIYADLVAVARHTGPHGRDDTDGGRAVTAWWPEARCARLWGDLVRPDAYGRWREHGSRGTEEVEFFLEYDTGTEPLHRLAGKLHDYQQLAAATGITTPVLFWLPSPAREHHARDTLAAALTGLDRPRLVPVATTAATPDIGAADSPAAARWLPLTPAGTTAPAARVRLAALAGCWPGTATVPPRRTPPTGDASRPVAVGGQSGLRPPTPMPPAPPAETGAPWMPS